MKFQKPTPNTMAVIGAVTLAIIGALSDRALHEPKYFEGKLMSLQPNTKPDGKEKPFLNKLNWIFDFATTILVAAERGLSVSNPEQITQNASAEKK